MALVQVFLSSSDVISNFLTFLTILPLQNFLIINRLILASFMISSRSLRRRFHCFDYFQKLAVDATEFLLFFSSWAKSSWLEDFPLNCPGDPGMESTSLNELLLLMDLGLSRSAVVASWLDDLLRKDLAVSTSPSLTLVNGDDLFLWRHRWSDS